MITLCPYIIGVPCFQLESQLRQLRLRAESEAVDVSQLKSDLEAAQVERLSLQKRIGLLSRKNEDLARENGMEVSCSRGMLYYSHITFDHRHFSLAKLLN